MPPTMTFPKAPPKVIPVMPNGKPEWQNVDGFPQWGHAATKLEMRHLDPFCDINSFRGGTRNFDVKGQNGARPIQHWKETLREGLGDSPMSPPREGADGDNARAAEGAADAGGAAGGAERPGGVEEPGEHEVGTIGAAFGSIGAAFSSDNRGGGGGKGGGAPSASAASGSSPKTPARKSNGAAASGSGGASGGGSGGSSGGRPVGGQHSRHRRSLKIGAHTRLNLSPESLSKSGGGGTSAASPSSQYDPPLYRSQLRPRPASAPGAGGPRRRTIEEIRGETLKQATCTKCGCIHEPGQCPFNRAGMSPPSAMKVSMSSPGLNKAKSPPLPAGKRPPWQNVNGHINFGKRLLNRQLDPFTDISSFVGGTRGFDVKGQLGARAVQQWKEMLREGGRPVINAKTLERLAKDSSVPPAVATGLLRKDAVTPVKQGGGLHSRLQAASTSGGGASGSGGGGGGGKKETTPRQRPKARALAPHTL